MSHPVLKDETQAVNAIRFLATDAIEKAKSGHPGMPLGAAAAAYVLWTRHLKHNPADPAWPDRDRFILSAGHASMLLYSLLYLTGYDLTLDDLKAFRQFGSKTAGHPERGHAPGVEITTGPLGQGIASAVGMAIAEAHLAARFNRPGHAVLDHFTYVMASDGDLMEGVAMEACALAGHLGLGKLIVLYDANAITLAGSTTLAFTEDIRRRHEAWGWQVLDVADGNDADAVDAAIRTARAESGRPTLIRLATCIGYGAPKKAGTFACHGSPLGAEELAGAKAALGWPASPDFYVPEEVLAFFRQARAQGQAAQDRWSENVVRYRAAFPDEADALFRQLSGELPAGWDAVLPTGGEKPTSTRKASEGVLQALAQTLPDLMGGSADLNPSCLTWIKGGGDFQRPEAAHTPVPGEVGGGWGYAGRNLHFGVREHAMGAIAVGLAAHGGLIPYTSTFLSFADYMRPSMRLAALMGIRAVFVFTHDSIGVGEDGPTHQPIEQVMNLRGVPRLDVIRPCDAPETAAAWCAAAARQDGPTVLILTRQDLPILDRTVFAKEDGLERGGYTLWESSPGNLPEAILLATGSEVALALAAGQKLAAEGLRVRLVSLPCWERFDRQPAEYRDAVLPPAVRARIAVEAGLALGWEHYVGLDGAIVALTDFGASAPAQLLFEHFGLTADRICAAARALLAR